MSELEWPEPVLLTLNNAFLIPDTTGVYRYRLADSAGSPIPVLRQGGKWDQGGVVYVGATVRSGTLRGRFGKHVTAHRDGWIGKIERNGTEQVLVALWRDIHRAYPGAILLFEYAIVEGHAQSGLMEKRLQAEYAATYGEAPVSGKVSLLHNPSHPWREHLSSQRGATRA